MISLSEARSIIATETTSLEPVRASLADAVGRILREEVRAPEDLPSFDRSAMDGYVISADDPAERLRVVAEIQPGAIPAFALNPGECARIYTGGAIPVGASQVLMQEEVRREGEWMIPARRGAATHIRRSGEDARRGDLLLDSRTRIGPGEAALLAQIGVMQVSVSPAPRVVHLTTGNELVPPHVQPEPGQIRDSNSTLIAALLAAHGAALLAQRHCTDRLDALVDAVRGLPEERWDLLLISGGASVGDYDFGARALESLGFTIHFRKVNLRPGKPLVFASRDRQLALVLPGNPVSHFETFHLAVRLALEGLESAHQAWPMLRSTLVAPQKPFIDERETWAPGRLELAGEARVTPLAWQSSGDLRGLVGANCLVRIPSSASPIEVGQSVECLWLEHRP